MLHNVSHHLPHIAAPTSIQPPHCPTSPPQSHESIPIATAHAARLLTAASLRPLALRQQGAVAATQPGNQGRERCQKWGSYRGREGGWSGGGALRICYCPVVLRNFMYTHPHTLTVG